MVMILVRTMYEPIANFISCSNIHSACSFNNYLRHKNKKITPICKEKQARSKQAKIDTINNRSFTL